MVEQGQGVQGENCVSISRNMGVRTVCSAQGQVTAHVVIGFSLVECGGMEDTVEVYLDLVETDSRETNIQRGSVDQDLLVFR